MLLSNYAFLDHLILDLFIVLFQDVTHFVSCSRLCTLRITTDAAHALLSRHRNVFTKELKFCHYLPSSPFIPEVAENRGTHLITTKCADLISVQRPAACTGITPAYYSCKDWVPTWCWGARANAVIGAPVVRFSTPRWEGRRSHRRESFELLFPGP